MSTFVERDARDWAVRQLKGVPPSPEKEARLEELYKERLAYREAQETKYRLARAQKGRVTKAKPADASPTWRHRLSGSPDRSSGLGAATHMGVRHNYWD